MRITKKQLKNFFITGVEIRNILTTSKTPYDLPQLVCDLLFSRPTGTMYFKQYQHGSEFYDELLMVCISLYRLKDADKPRYNWLQVIDEYMRNQPQWFLADAENQTYVYLR